MRIPPRFVPFALAALLAACATPTPPPPESPPEVVAVPAPEPVVAAPAPRPAVPDPFANAAGEELEPLPAPADDLWARIRRGYAMPELDDPLVEKWEQWYLSRPDYVARMIDRSRRYLYYIVVEVEQRDMPLEIALLPMVESAFNPNAMSVSRASGIWQFMPRTGTDYGLKQNFWFDSRRDVVAATEGALTYLLQAPRRLQRLAARACRLQLGRRQRRARRREEREGRPAGRLSQSQDAGRDPQLPAEAAGA